MLFLRVDAYPLLFRSRLSCKRTSYPDHCVTSVTDCCVTVCVLGLMSATNVKYFGCQESQGSTRAEAQMRVTKAIKAQARYSRGLWAPPFRLLEHQNQAVADAGSEHFPVCSRSSCVATERRGNAEQVAKPRTTTHCKIRCSCGSRAHARTPKEAWRTHSRINDASSEVTVGIEMVARSYIFRGGADMCRRSHESDGVWTTVV